MDCDFSTTMGAEQRRRMTARLALGLLAATLLTGAGTLAAAAMTITETIAFTAQGFRDLNLNAGPVDPWTGQFSITFDPAGGHQSGTLNSFSSNLTVGIAATATWDFVYAPFQLTIGDSCNANGCGLAIGNPGTAQLDFGVGPLIGADALYATSSSIFETTKVSATSSTPLPEPGSLLLFTAGLVGLATLRLRRRLIVSSRAGSLFGPKADDCCSPAGHGVA